MNVMYDKFNTQDVAKIFGVAPQTVSAWVRNGLIEATNVSDGTEKARYMFTDEAVTKVQNLIKKHGTRKWMLYARNTAETKSTSLGDVIVIPTKKSEPAPALAPAPEVETKAKEFNPDKIMDKILQLQDLKERLENLEAERNQIMNEIEALRKDIMEVI